MLTLRGRKTLQLFIALSIVALLPEGARAAVDGKVVNATTGKPAAGVMLTLLKFDNGMDPVEEVRSDASGAFAFQKPLMGASGQPVPGMVRAEFQGVSYTEMIPPGRPGTGLEVKVFEVEEKQVLAPRGHVMIFEPGTDQMVVNENYAFFNESNPPRTYRDAEKGTLRFYLPPEAKGIVQVRTAGPQRMPLRSVATPTGEENIYKVDFPLKPGENSIDMSYMVPYTSGAEFKGRVMYQGIETRIAVPSGVTVAGKGLESLGQEPRTQAMIYQVEPAASYSVQISGEGRLSGGGGESEAAPGGEGSGKIRVEPAPVAEELYWILGLTAGVLLFGFYFLYNAAQPGAATESEDSPEPSKRSPALKATRRPAPQAKR